MAEAKMEREHKQVQMELKLYKVGCVLFSDARAVCQKKNKKTAN